MTPTGDRTYVLLLGAGFTYNWGGWLASEVFEYLLGCDQIDASIRQLLWEKDTSGEGFEAALEELQTGNRPDKEVLIGKFTAAIVQMLSEMNAGLCERQFEFQNYRELQVATFLKRFDAIFTLNYDLLLENCYLDAIAPDSRWTGFRLPGLRPAAGLTTGPWVLSKTPETIRSTEQPYFKLHGSSNWEGDNSIIIGGGKASAIDQHPLLSWYHQQLSEHLSKPRTRLMIIGYSFGDQHVNSRIQSSGAEIFVIDPLGANALNQGYALPEETPLRRKLRSRVIGASRRPLPSIFGKDAVEHAKVMKFFA